MKINSAANCFITSPNFGNALSTKQEKDYLKTMKEIDELNGKKDGMRVVKLYAPSLPSSEDKDTGIGKVNSDEAKRFYEMAKVYGGATAIKFMPIGQLTDKGEYNDKHYPGAYFRSSLTVGEDVIDFTKLATPEYGNILSKEDVDKLIEAHKKNDRGENLIDFESTLGWKNQEDYSVNEQLRTAFDNFKNTPSPNKELKALRKEFEAFKTQKEPVDYDDIYTRIALFPWLKDWGNGKADFFVGYDSNPEIRAQKQPEYERLKKEHEYDIEFFKFKQFLGHKALDDAKKTINDLGMDMMGDANIGFSWVESQVFPDAFEKDQNSYSGFAESGWTLPALNYNELINCDDGPAHKLFKAKISHFLNKFDGIRFDVGWAYMNPKLMYNRGSSVQHLNAGNKITNFIEETAREVKGKDFDQKKLIYECDAGADDFSLWNNKDTIKNLKGMVVLSTANEHQDDPTGWGNYSFIKENIGLGDDDFILGTNNHDLNGVLQCASDKAKSSKHVGALMRVFRLREQDGKKDGWKLLKDDNNDHEHIKKYIRARFAETDYAKNSFIQSTDMLGRGESIDYHTGGRDCPEAKLDYQTRLERNFEENYHRAIQDDVGYNAADVKKFRMEMDGVDGKHRALYEKAAKYAEYLKHKGGIYTREQADNSKEGKLDITSLSMDEIKSL